MQIYREKCQVISLKKMNSAGICQENQYCRPNHTPFTEARTLAAEGVEASGLWLQVRENMVVIKTRS